MIFHPGSWIFSDLLLDPSGDFKGSHILLLSEHLLSGSMTDYYSLLKIRCSILTHKVSVSFFPAQGLIKDTTDVIEILPSSVKTVHQNLLRKGTVFIQ